MNGQDFAERRNYFDAVHGVTLRAIDAFSDADLDFRPNAAMRTPRELVFHMYAQEKQLAEAARDGRLTDNAAAAGNPEHESGGAVMRELRTVRELRAYADACHRAASAIYGAMSDEEIGRRVESPFGAFPAWRYQAFAYDEHWHHRGQLYTYLRLLGKAPPMLYDYA